MTVSQPPWVRAMNSVADDLVEKFERYGPKTTMGGLGLGPMFLGMEPEADGSWVHYTKAAAALIDAVASKDAEIERLTKALANPWCPDSCPITARPFFMWIDGEPTYGGPFDSYTIPTRDAEGEFSCRRYDHDEGGWKDWDEGLAIKVVDESDWLNLEDRAETAERMLAEERGKALDEAAEMVMATVKRRPEFETEDEGGIKWQNVGEVIPVDPNSISAAILALKDTQPLSGEKV